MVGINIVVVVVATLVAPVVYYLNLLLQLLFAITLYEFDKDFDVR